MANKWSLFNPSTQVQPLEKWSPKNNDQSGCMKLFWTLSKSWLNQSSLEPQPSMGCIGKCWWVWRITLRAFQPNPQVLLGQNLLEIGLIRPEDEKYVGARAADFCPHHVSHHLGMDVHDTASVSKTSPLQPGMVITVEPGCYIPSSSFLDKVDPAFLGLGVRLEDDLLITESGVEILSSGCPSDPKVMQGIVSISSWLYLSLSGHRTPNDLYKMIERRTQTLRNQFWRAYFCYLILPGQIFRTDLADQGCFEAFCVLVKYAPAEGCFRCPFHWCGI